MKYLNLFMCVVNIILFASEHNVLAKKQRISRRGNVFFTPAPFSGLQLASGQVPVAVPVPIPVPYPIAPTAPTHQKIVIYQIFAPDNSHGHAQYVKPPQIHSLYQGALQSAIQGDFGNLGNFGNGHGGFEGFPGFNNELKFNNDVKFNNANFWSEWPPFN